MRHRFARRLLGGVTAGALIALVIPGSASADVALPDNTVALVTQPNTYTFSTSTPYWSIVDVQSSPNTDFDLVLLAGTTQTTLSSSVQGRGRADFVAINSNAGFRPYGSYRAVVSRFSGTGNYAVQQVQGRTVTTLPVPANDGVSGPSDPDIAFAVLPGERIVSVVDIYLNAGEKFWADDPAAANRLYLLESNPTMPATFFRNRAQAATAIHETVDGCTLYTANYAGWHGLALVSDAMPVAPGTGYAFALHRFNPAKPSTCPIKNFPAPTPP